LRDFTTVGFKGKKNTGAPTDFCGETRREAPLGEGKRAHGRKKIAAQKKGSQSLWVLVRAGKKKPGSAQVGKLIVRGGGNTGNLRRTRPLFPKRFKGKTWFPIGSREPRNQSKYTCPIVFDCSDWLKELQEKGFYYEKVCRNPVVKGESTS